LPLTGPLRLRHRSPVAAAIAVKPPIAEPRKKAASGLPLLLPFFTVIGELPLIDVYVHWSFLLSMVFLPFFRRGPGNRVSAA
jgi:hypothetical protein